MLFNFSRLRLILRQDECALLRGVLFQNIILSMSLFTSGLSNASLSSHHHELFIDEAFEFVLHRSILAFFRVDLLGKTVSLPSLFTSKPHSDFVLEAPN